jgi:hypothetical protein
MTIRANSQVLEALRVKINDEVIELTAAISSGGCKDIEEYRSKSGEIRGLMTAERELLDLDERMRSD